MAKDYAKVRPVRSKKNRKLHIPQAIWVLALLIIFFVILAVGAFSYEKKKLNLASNKETFQAIKSEAKAFFSSKKPVLHQPTLAENALSTLPQVQFEFYEALTQGEPDRIKKETARQLTLNSQQATVPRKHSSTLESASRVASAEKSTSAVAPTQKIFNADDLSLSIATEVSKSRFLIQLGTFNNYETAKRFLLALKQAGVNAKIIETKMAGKILFNVQSGPFGTDEEARKTARLYERRGIVSTIQEV